MKWYPFYASLFLVISCTSIGNEKKEVVPPETEGQKLSTVMPETPKTTNCAVKTSEASEMNLKGCVKTLSQKDLYYYDPQGEAQQSTTVLHFNQKGFLVKREYTGTTPEYNSIEITKMESPVRKGNMEWKQADVLKSRVEYAYDIENNLITSTTVDYQPDGKKEYSQQEYIYDSIKRLVGVRHYRNKGLNTDVEGQKPYLRTEVQYDSDTRRIHRTYRDEKLTEIRTMETNNEGKPFFARIEDKEKNTDVTAAYTYDTQGNILEIKTPYSNETNTYTYDSVGNYTRKERFDRGRRIQVSEITYTYFD